MSEKTTMTAKRLHILGRETFKTLNTLNPNFAQDVIHYSYNLAHNKYNLEVKNCIPLRIWLYKPSHSRSTYIECFFQKTNCTTSIY